MYGPETWLFFFVWVKRYVKEGSGRGHLSP
jgi:hypothetical protein